MLYQHGIHYQFYSVDQSHALQYVAEPYLLVRAAHVHAHPGLGRAGGRAGGGGGSAVYYYITPITYHSIDVIYHHSLTPPQLPPLPSPLPHHINIIIF